MDYLDTPNLFRSATTVIHDFNKLCLFCQATILLSMHWVNCVFFSSSNYIANDLNKLCLLCHSIIFPAMNSIPRAYFHFDTLSSFCHTVIRLQMTSILCVYVIPMNWTLYVDVVTQLCCVYFVNELDILCLF